MAVESMQDEQYREKEKKVVHNGWELRGQTDELKGV